MPPRDDTVIDRAAPPRPSSRRPRPPSGNPDGKSIPWSSKEHREMGGGGDEREHTRRKKERGSKKGEKKKRRAKKNGHETRSPPGGNSKNVSEVEGVTVSRFLQGQLEMQHAASHRRSNSFRQRMLREQHELAGAGHWQGLEGEVVHYIDDDSEDDERERRAVVPRKKTSNSQLPPEKEPVVDAVPADHPYSSIIQTHRTCSLCHRTLPRSQFSERDRYSVNVSLAPGPTCRTCSMTVSAVKLKSIPGTEKLLLEYARRGMQQGGMAMNNDGGDIAGYLENSELTLEDGALVLRKDSTGNGIIGKELTLYGGAPINDIAKMNNANVMGMTQPRDVNSAFSGRPYGHTDEDRPANVADCKYIDALLMMPSYLNLNAFGLFASSEEVSVSLAALEAARIYGTLEQGYFVPHNCDGKPVPEHKEGRKRMSQKTSEAVAGEPEHDKNPQSIVCLVLNEGPMPRTAVLASQHYGWTTLAIDPSLSEEWDGYHDDIQHFMGYSGSIADFMDSAKESVVEFRHQAVQHLVVIGIQHEKDSLRLKRNGHIYEIRSRYEDVPTTLVSLSPVRKATLAPMRRAGQSGSKLERDVGHEPNCSYIDEGVFSKCRFVEVWNFHTAEDGESVGEDDGSYNEKYSDKDNDEGSHSKAASLDESTVGTTESDYLNKRQDEEKEEDEHETNKFEEQIMRTASENRKNNDSKPKGEKGGNDRREWLEEQVAEFKKRHDAKQEDKEEQAEQQQEDLIGSLSTRNTMGVSDTMKAKDIDLSVNTVEQNEGPSSEISAELNDDHDEGNHEMALWSPPDEEVTNQVWEKALAKHDKQESLCNQLEENYGSDSILGGQDHLEDGDDCSREENPNSLPPGWEAILDPDSGDYYYTNWDSGAVTWDHPLSGDDVDTTNMVNGQSGVDLTVKLEDCVAGDFCQQDEAPDNYDDRHSNSRAIMTSHNENLAVAESAITPITSFGNAGVQMNETPPLVQHSNLNNMQRKLNNYSYDDASENGSPTAYLFDDQSSTSSGIAALSRWNKRPPVPANDPSNLGKINISGSQESEDIIVWSDDEHPNGGSDEPEPIQRSGNGTLGRRQPWHKEDVTQGNDNSFIYD